MINGLINLTKKVNQLFDRAKQDPEISAGLMAGARAASMIGPISAIRKGLKRKNEIKNDSSSMNDDIAQNTFLMSPENQEKVFVNNNWEKLNTDDYKLVNKAVQNFKERTGKEVPMYQKSPDDIDRSQLTVLGNVNDHWYGDENAVPKHMYHYPSAIYLGQDGNIYQNVWDFNNYGSHDAGRGTTYGRKQRFADWLDEIGSPVVVTSGYKKLNDEGLFKLLSNIKQYPSLYKNLKESGFRLNDEQFNNFKSLYEMRPKELKTLKRKNNSPTYDPKIENYQYNDVLEWYDNL